MNITVNDIPVELSGTPSLREMLEQLGHGPAGSALAVNQTIIPRSRWAEHPVNEGDDILLFQAIAGG
ncbi:sulfur carrier protein ThiS [Acerihabitans arboris]|uniref:Sulfur carrier protein ThiS n=1 Tax=Acerihabitans arboris TaxID=2691583 RepID=A0A845ST76_9GAMM|nr:sulfur carrier protein ThiS [Acerihabitans arboris]NDL65938.1 sulfur carrier protein ThiS [Acerihabitans arboris]